MAASRQPHGHWTGDGQNTKSFFDNYAQKRNLDPQNPRSWFNVTQKDILQQPVSLNYSFINLFIHFIFVILNLLFFNKGGPSILYHFNGSVVRAIAHVYPDLDLQEAQFDKMSSTLF